MRSTNSLVCLWLIAENMYFEQRNRVLQDLLAAEPQISLNSKPATCRMASSPVPIYFYPKHWTIGSRFSQWNNASKHTIVLRNGCEHPNAGGEENVCDLFLSTNQ